MAVCPLCENEVKALKTNSHIVPRWMLAELKENGRLVKMSAGETHLRSADDPKFDIVCASCEEEFAADDTFSACFFRTKSHLLETKTATNGKLNVDYEVISDEGRKGIFKFIVGLILRNHLKEKVESKKELLGPYFNILKTHYLNNTLNWAEFPFWCCKYTMLEKTINWPSRTRFDKMNGHDVLIFGYRFFLITDKTLFPENEFIQMSNHVELLIPVIHGERNALSQDFLKMLKENRRR